MKIINQLRRKAAIYAKRIIDAATAPSQRAMHKMKPIFDADRGMAYAKTTTYHYQQNVFSGLHGLIAKALRLAPGYTLGHIITRNVAQLFLRLAKDKISQKTT